MHFLGAVALKKYQCHAKYEKRLRLYLVTRGSYSPADVLGEFHAPDNPRNQFGAKSET